MNKSTLLLVIFAFFWVQVDSILRASKNTPASFLWNDTWTDKLKHDLLLKYDKLARPAQHFNSTHVQMDFTIRHISMDEKKSLVTINAWTHFTWTDDKLKWNPNEYGGQNKLHVAESEVWKPDIVLYNSAIYPSLDHYGSTNCIIYNNGEVLWVPTSQFAFFCNTDLRKWPFDRQNCMLSFGSWTYSNEEINLNFSKQTGSTENLDPCEWKIVSVKKTHILKYYPCCPEPYPRLDLELTLQRGGSLHGLLLIVPLTVCVILTLSVLWLHPTSIEKFITSGVTAVILLILVIYFSQELMTVTGRMPIILEFYLYNLLLVSLSFVTSILVLNKSKNSEAKPSPWLSNLLLTGRLRRILKLPEVEMHRNYMEHASEELHDGNLISSMQDQDSKNKTSKLLHDWVVLAMAINRVIFAVYVIIFLMLFVVLFLM
uniref:Neurotransmitter-gated ion-channel ligand-binding domain-containing protein n=1 Tax=Clastoptera arizonana TaxID=38151 RepID=A0A1B6CAN8_9HEMI